MSIWGAMSFDVSVAPSMVQNGSTAHGMHQHSIPGCGSPHQSASFPVQRATSAGPAGDKLTRAATQQWGLALGVGERVLWGPCLFHEEILQWCRCRCSGTVSNLKSPTALVTITDRRLVIMQFETWGLFANLAMCRWTRVTSVAVVPLRWVLGFCIEEEFSLQQAMLTRIMGTFCYRPLSESNWIIRVLTNAGLGKIYLSSLFVRQRVLPFGLDPQCNFEEAKILELRRWLGNVALFFGQTTWGTQRARALVELQRCARGWAP